MDLLHVGEHRRPERCAPHRPDTARGWVGARGRGRHVARRCRLDRASVRGHRRPRLRLSILAGSNMCWSRRSSRRGHPCSASTASRWSGGAPLSTSCSSPSSASSRTPESTDVAVHVGRGELDIAGAAHLEAKREIGGRFVGHGSRDDVEAPMIAPGVTCRHDEGTGQQRREAGRGCAGQDRAARRDARRTDEEGEVRVRGPMVFRGYTDSALNADAFDQDGTSAPATSGSSVGTATWC